MNLQGKINLIKLAKEAIRNAIISMGIIPSGNISTYADAITQIDTVNNTSLTVNPSTTSQTLRPSSEYTGYGVVNVNPVTASIDSDIVASNIKTGVEILGVTGEVDELIGQSKTITENGVYIPDSGYNAFTSVTVDTPIGITREIQNGRYQLPSSNFTFSLPNNVNNIGGFALQNAFYYSTKLTSIDLSSVTTISGEESLKEAFYNCTNLTSVDLSGLTTVSGEESLREAFYNCTNLTSVDLSNLTTISGINSLYYTFAECSSLTSVDLSNLTTISSNMSSAFSKCSNLTSVDLSNLTTISGYHALSSAFAHCKKLTSLSFPSLTSNSFGSLYTNQFYNMLLLISDCTVHFPSNLQSVIGSWDDVVAGFGGTNTTVLFDLPATT